MSVEVAPIAHYHMGGIRVSPTLETRIANLFAAGEAIGGANGANRLSGNAITEALVFGRFAGAAAAARISDLSGAAWRDRDAAAALALVEDDGVPAGDLNPAALIAALQDVMARDVGPFRTGAGLSHALGEIARLKTAIGTRPPERAGGFDTRRLDWFDLRAMLLVAEVVAQAALARDESRGAHQREDFPTLSDAWQANQIVSLAGGRITLARAATQ
jgi:succinate dehydrogenase/fumarate reductase flavoprotein subunit